MRLKLDARFAEHPKIVGLSDAAFREHVLQLLYAARHLTDGHIPPAAIRRPDVVDELVEAGLWEPTEAGWRIHDWLDYNPSRSVVESRRIRDANRKREQRSARTRRKAAAAAPDANGRRASRPRDVIVDALAEVEGADPMKLTRPHARRLGVAAAEIRRVAPGVDVEEIRRRAARYRAKWPTWPLTASALASRWASLEHDNGRHDRPAYLELLES